jgi:hypothetical protein
MAVVYRRGGGTRFSNSTTSEELQEIKPKKGAWGGYPDGDG